MLSLLALLPFSLLGQSFEGVVELERVGPEGRSIIRWFVKPGKLALETEMITKEGTFLVRSVPDPATGTLHMRIFGKDGQQTYHLPVSAISPGTVPSKVVPVKGETGTDAAYGSFQAVVINAGSTITKTKIALDVDVDFRQYAVFFLNDESVRAMVALQSPGLPVEAITENLDGQETARLTFRSIQRQKVADNEFVIP